MPLLLCSWADAERGEKFKPCPPGCSCLLTLRALRREGRASDPGVGAMEMWSLSNHLCISEISGSLWAGKQYTQEARLEVPAGGRLIPARGPVFREPCYPVPPGLPGSLWDLA